MSSEDKLNQLMPNKMNPSFDSQSYRLQGDSNDKESELSSSNNDSSSDQDQQESQRGRRFPAEVNILGYNNNDEEEKKYNGSIAGAQRMPYMQSRMK